MGKLILEIWYYKATLPNSGGTKDRPVLIIGDDQENSLNIIDIHYCLISASAPKGRYDILIDTTEATELGLLRASVIKTTKIYTGSKNLLGRKICDLPKNLKDEFIEKYKSYQSKIFNVLDTNA